MIDYEKLDKLMELPVSEEMLGAYLEGNLSDVERDSIERVLSDGVCHDIVREINESNLEDIADIPDLDAIELPSEGEYTIDIDEENDDIIKLFADMKDYLSNGLEDAAESRVSAGANLSVGEDAVDVTSSHVLQSYRDTCAIKSQQLILEKFGKHISEDQLVQQAYENGWYRPGYGTSVSDMGEILRENGVPCTNYSNCNIAHVVSALADGRQIMMAVDSGELWKRSFVGELWEKIEDKLPLIGGADHALLVTGIDASDPSDVKVIVTDPGSGALNKPYPLKQFIDAAEDSKFFMTVTDDPAPHVFDSYEPGTTHLPMIGDMNYYEFMHQFGDYMQDGDVLPDNVWNDFKLSAFGGDVGIGSGIDDPVVTLNTNQEHFDGDDEEKTAEEHEEERAHPGVDDGDEEGENEGEEVDRENGDDEINDNDGVTNEGEDKEKEEEDGDDEVDDEDDYDYDYDEA